MRKVGKPKEKVTLLGTYDVDHNNHIVHSLGVDERGKYYSVEEHEYNGGSAYSVCPKQRFDSKIDSKFKW